MYSSTLWVSNKFERLLELVAYFKKELKKIKKNTPKGIAYIFQKNIDKFSPKKQINKLIENNLVKYRNCATMTFIQ